MENHDYRDDYRQQREAGLKDLETRTPDGQADDYMQQRRQELVGLDTEQPADMRKERKTYTPEETQEAKKKMKTQGRKGVKAQRINMAFAPDTYLYIKVMSAARGQTITDFVNEIVRQSMEANAENYEKAKEFIDQFKSI